MFAHLRERMRKRAWFSHSAPPDGAKMRVRSLAERLGHAPDARLLIVHADDLGLAKSVNAAFAAGLNTGLINSGSAMVPCPAFDEIATFAREHPEADIGLHLTLTSEDAANRWRPVAGPASVPSLVDEDGYLLQEWPNGARIDLRDVEVELRAQIDAAYGAGLRPTHIDSHQFRLQMRGRGLFDVYARLGREYELPILVTGQWFAKHPYLESALAPNEPLLDRVYTIGTAVAPEEWRSHYGRVLRSLQPGVTELLIHPGHDDEELRMLFGDRLAWGAAWRQRDFDFFTGEDFRSLITENDLKLINWRDLAHAMVNKK